MNDRALPLLPLGILLLLAGMTFWLSSYVEHQGAEKAANKRNDPDVVIEKFSAQKLSPAGDVQYVVTADKMTHYPRDDSAVLEKIVFAATSPGP
jgi:lipopolysaccharide export system protein LptC